MPIEQSLRQQAAEGRSLAMECNAPAGRRAFVEVRPQGGAKTLEASLSAARDSGGIPRAHAFDVAHVEYDATALDGWDYDVGRVTHGRETVASLDAVESVIESWGLDPAHLRPYHQTDAPWRVCAVTA